jgi:hypothetical protein
MAHRIVQINLMNRPPANSPLAKPVISNAKIGVVSHTNFDAIITMIAVSFIISH